MKLTKHKGPRGWWIVRADGRETGIEISRGDAPKWGNSQMWDVTHGPDDRYLFEARGLDGAMATLAQIAAALYPED